MFKKALRLILAGLLIIALTAVAGCTKKPVTEDPTDQSTGVNTNTLNSYETADEVKLELINGNARFVSGKYAKKDFSKERRKELAEKGQKPYAIVVACSDSRVSPELILDQALGEIFVIRTAGNVVDPITIGSIEYAVEHLNPPMLMVMGHENCGAVTAAVEAGDKEVPGNLGSIVEKIKPSVKKAKAEGASGTDLIEKSAEENIKAVIAELQEKSPIIKEALQSGSLTAIGTKYDLVAGRWSSVK